MIKPLHSSAQLCLLHYLLPIIQVYRTNNTICPVSIRLARGLERAARSHQSGSLDIDHQSSRLHCPCMLFKMVNTAALRKLPTWAYLSDCTPQLPHLTALSPCLHLCHGAWKTNFYCPHRREENHYFKSVWLFVRVAQDRGAEDGKAQAVLIDLCSPLISLTGSWFIEMRPRVRQGYGSKHPACSLTLRVMWNWGQLTVRRTHAPTIPYANHSLLIIAYFGVGWGDMRGRRLGGKKESIRG